MTVRVVGRYALHHEIAAGGMATVHLGRLLGPVGFSRTVAVKCLHPHFARDPELVAMFLDEARLAARIRHPNVVPTLDVVAQGGEIFLVMEYVQGESLASLVRRAGDAPISLRVAAAILVGVLHGLHAAHVATDERGAPLDLVHRDVSPQNVLVGVDGVPRLLDFGIARAAGRVSATREGHLKGKLAYMAPEQLHGEPATRRSDVFGAAVVLWETLAGARLFPGDSEAAVMERVLFGDIPRLSTRRADVPAELDELVARGLSREAAARFATAREMAVELERIVPVASATEVTAWVEAIAGDALAARAAAVGAVERTALPDAGADVPGVAGSRAEVSPVGVVLASAVDASPPVTEEHPPTRRLARPTLPARRSRGAGLAIAGLVVAGIVAGVLALRGANRAAATSPALSPGTPASPPAVIVPVAASPARAADAPPAVEPSSAASSPVPAAAPSAAPRALPPSRRPAKPRTPLDGLPADRE